jgi:hypothetical protein
MRAIKLAITCGEETCAESPGVLCEHLVLGRGGLSAKCSLFNVEIRDADGGIFGWLVRDVRCLAAECQALVEEV